MQARLGEMIDVVAGRAHQYANDRRDGVNRKDTIRQRRPAYLLARRSALPARAQKGGSGRR